MFLSTQSILLTVVPVQDHANYHYVIYFFTVSQYNYTQLNTRTWYTTSLYSCCNRTCLVLFQMTVAVPYLTCLTVISLFSLKRILTKGL